METFWFFRLRFRRAYDSAYDSDFWFSLGRKHSYDFDYDSDYDSVASENQPLGAVKRSAPNLAYWDWNLSLVGLVRVPSLHSQGLIIFLFVTSVIEMLVAFDRLIDRFPFPG